MQTILLRRGDYSIGATSKLGSNSDKQPVGWTVPESERLLETGALLKNLLPAETGKIKLVIIFWGQLKHIFVGLG